MHKSVIAFAMTALLSLFALVTTPGSAAQSSVPLSSIADRSGYTLHWLLPERSVSLARPGLVIVVRPGALMYEVNNHVEFTDTPPQYRSGDIFVSSSLAARLARLATIAARAEQPASVARLGPSEVPASGAITMDVRQQPGTEGISVSGHAPSQAPVTVTLLATISADIPTVVVSRQNIQPDANGNFQAVVPVAPDYLRGSFLRVLATSVSGVTPATAQITVGPPNGGVTVPAEQTPQPAR